jgi:hypothetical protein
MIDLTAKPPLLQQALVLGHRREEPGSDLVGITAMERTDRPHRRGDGRHIAVTAELADEAALRAKRAMDAGDHELGPAHPVQRRVGEDRVELGFERKGMAVDPLHLEALAGGDGKQLLAQIGPKHIGAVGGDRFSQHAVAATEVENALAVARREEIDHGTGKLRDEAPLHGIVVGLPALDRFWRGHCDRTHFEGPGCHGS